MPKRGNEITEALISAGIWLAITAALCTLVLTLRGLLFPPAAG